MPCGPQLIEAVAGQLYLTIPQTPKEIQRKLLYHDGICTTRSIRYALAELIKQGRAKREGQQGPVYAVNKESKNV